MKFKRRHNATDIERFCQLVARGEAAGEAARLSERFQEDDENPDRNPHIYAMRASALLKKEQVQSRIAALKAEVEAVAAAKYAVDREWVLRKLIDNVNRSMQAEPVLDSDGAPTGEWKYDGATANRSLELIGKEFGMFVTRQVNVNVDLGDPTKLSDADLIARYNAARIRAGAIDVAAQQLIDTKPAGSAD